ncbi:MAG: hypothetical protein C5B53_12690 [Candidatus Melainabacteria bacterium]|nr:MAG: hypothetical protein C5B53_12690 [Candidatus Melainabacteria bacterium]
MQATAAGAVEPSRSRQIPTSQWHVLIAAWLGNAFDGLDASIFTIVLYPAMSELLKTTSHSLVGVYGSVILAALMLGYFVGGVGFGMLADRIGRTKAMMLTILLYALCTGLCALSHNWIELAFYRFLVGCGIGGEVVVAGVTLAESWPGQSRLKAMGFYCAAFSFGYILAATLNLFFGYLGWRWLFVAGVLPAFLTLYIRFKVKDPAEFEILKQYKARLRAKPKSELTSDQTAIIRPTLPQVFSPKNRYRTFLAVCLGSTAIVGYWAVLSWISPWINQMTGTNAIAERSWAAIVMNIGGILGAMSTWLAVDRLGRAMSFRVAFLGACLCNVSMFLTVQHFGPQLLVWCFLVGMFSHIPFALLLIYLPELFDAEIRGTAVGFSYNAGRLIGAAAALASGQLVALFGGSYAMAGACCALLYLGGVLASLFLKPQPITLGQIASLEQSSEQEPVQLAK